MVHGVVYECLCMLLRPWLFLLKQVAELGVCWNSVIRRLFNYNKWESVKDVLYGLGRLNIAHLILLHKVQFYRRIGVFLSELCCAELISVFQSVLLYTKQFWSAVFLRRETAIDLVYGMFEEHVSYNNFSFCLFRH